jgi:UTP--glucose-1-phosphate uridylyltransferase
MIRKAVIPVAGWGTRVLPATKSIPKPMLPVADLPTIYYVVEEAVASGVEHIIFVTSRHMRAVEDFFDENTELTNVLASKHNDQMLDRLRHIESLAKFSFVRQPRPRGLGHAVLMAHQLVGDEPFAVMLGDDLVVNDAGRPCLGQIADAFEQQGDGSVLAVMRVPEQDVSRYGVVAGEPAGHRLTKVRGMVEKPSIAEAPSNLAVIGRYVLTPEIFAALHHTPAGKGGEIQLTDALCLLLGHQPVYAYEYAGIRYDTGDTLGWIETSIAYTLRRPDLAPGLKAYLRTLDLSE